ncbi:MAG: ATP-binding protein [Acholeplasmataceae bacterium]|nr:ATP-binding protein [Acholeplasmataceae bacterium]
MKYYDRLIEKTLKIELEAFGAVLISGPKWCGKTTTATKLANSSINLQDPINKENYLKILSINPDSLLNETPPMLIDEWQEAPYLWDYVRQNVDKKRGIGLYILTGSSTVDSSLISHSGVGRISRLTMRTLSLYESEHSTGLVSLLALFNNDCFRPNKSKLTINDYAELVIRGGFPDTIDKPLNIVKRQLDGYLNIISNQEIKTVYGAQKNATIVQKILKSLARNIGTQASITTIISNLANEEVNIHRETLASYINAFRDLFIIEDLNAWTPKLRSSANVRTLDTRHFIDPALAARVLNAQVEDLLIDFNTFGYLFESLVIRDLRIYTEHIGGRVFHYHDSYGYEADAVIHLDDGRWGLVEVKLGGKQIDRAANNLIKISKNIDTNKAPSFLMIITGGELAYQRSDGVYVVPIGSLKP